MGVSRKATPDQATESGPELWAVIKRCRQAGGDVQLGNHCAPESVGAVGFVVRCDASDSNLPPCLLSCVATLELEAGVGFTV